MQIYYGSVSGNAAGPLVAVIVLASIRMLLDTGITSCDLLFTRIKTSASR